MDNHHHNFSLKFLHGQSLFTGLEIRFTGLIYLRYHLLFCTRIFSSNFTFDVLYSYPTFINHNSFPILLSVFRVCVSFSSHNKPMIAQKIILYSSSYTQEVRQEAGSVGLIMATNPTNLILPSDDDFPIIEVEYEYGT